MARRLLTLSLLLALPGVLSAQADSLPQSWLRFRTRLPGLELPPAFRSPWLAASRVPPGMVGQAWADSTQSYLDSARVERQTAIRLRDIYGKRDVAIQTAVDTLGTDRGLLGVSRKYVDLAIDGLAHFELRSERLRNERCTPAELLNVDSGCRGGFTAPRLDTQFSVRVGGLIGRRLHANMDYDTERDFSGSNNIQVYYEGLEDEVVRRVEIGTVTFVPPRSRFITAGIPANNFGINATFEVGALQLQTMAATQKGSQIAERSFVIGERTSTPQDRQIRDLDFESGRFFFVVDPQSLSAYPAVDILTLDPATVPPTNRPAQVRIYRYRPGANKSGANPNLGGISAVARRSDSNQRVGPLQSLWQLLVPGADYYLDPSGLWFVLASRLDLGDYLAVSYITASGDSVGTFPAQDNPLAADSLELIVEPRVSALLPTFRYEMRQVYRVAGLDLDRNSLSVELSLNRSQQPQSGGSSTYLALLGLATSSDPTVMDADNRLFPRARDPGADQAVKESYIIFPHLQPFADQQRLTLQERSDSLYRTPIYLLLAEGPSAKFQFRLQYVSSTTGDRSVLDLNALQIRSGSERISIGGRVLERGVDYNISYDVGQVTFLNPNALFGVDPVTVTARFEERGLFAVAPTQIFGLASTYRLGPWGNISAVGIYQKEQTAFNRPPLGFEAAANLVGGINTELNFQPSGITRLINSITSAPATAPSRLQINGEVAFTRPDPNRSGQAYLEEFEGDNGIPVGLREAAWEFGGKPQYTDGINGVVGAVFDTADAVAFTWQNLVPNGSGGVVELRAQDIDPQIQTQGQQQSFETILFSTLHADTAGGLVRRNSSSRWSLPARPLSPRWRSIVTGLSTTGVDLSKNEFLEFWVFQDGTKPADSAGVELVFDLGTVSEDAVAIAPTNRTISANDTTYTGRQLIGVGRLDTERQTTGIFNAQTDDIGILGDRPDSLLVPGGGSVARPALCQQTLGEVVPFYPWGDLSSRCSNGNGFLDTEDLNSDNQLDATGPNENAFRWVVDLKTATYFVRDGVPTPDSLGGWKLYRLPLRQPGFNLGTPNLRLIQNLRVTVIAPPDNGGPDVVARFAIARMRFTGAPWIRRSDTPVLGFAGATGQAHGSVTASIVSTENVELGYVSPPGVGGSTNSRNGSRNDTGIQINERSLRVIGEQLAVGERAEGYQRFPSGPQNLLKYRDLRVWARGRGTGWDQGDFQAFFKVGADNANFYQFMAPASTTTWLPEMVIQLSIWRDLRARIEQRVLQGLPADSAARVACGGDTVSTAYVACSGSYLVYVTDPLVNPPNLAAVQEMSAGIYRVANNTGATDTEVWIDDIRVADPVSEVGTTYALDARLSVSDVGDISAGYVFQDGNFQQLGRDPTYLNTGAILLGTAWRLDRFLPPRLGISLPASVSYTRSSTDPLLLAGTDVRADALNDLRKPESWSVTYQLSLRRSQRGRTWTTRAFVDPLSFSALLNRGHGQTDLTSSETHSYDYRMGYTVLPGRGGVSLGLSGVVDKLPGFMRNSDGGKAMRTPFLNFVPTNFRLSSGLTRNESDLKTFIVPVQQASDALVLPLTSLTHTWTNSAGLTWTPLGMLTMSGDVSSTRDLRDYADSTTQGRVVNSEKQSLFGLDVGVERDRTVATTLALTPRVTTWFRPRFLTSSQFLMLRSLTGRQPFQEIGDTAGAFILPSTLNNRRLKELGAAFDLTQLFTKAPTGEAGRVQAPSKFRFRPIDVRTAIEHSSTYDLPAFDPDLGFMLALGGLDDFRKHEGERALGVAEIRTTAVGGGADLPWGFTLTAVYARIRTTRLQLVDIDYLNTESFQREWPSGSLRWTRPLARGPLALLALGAAFRQREGSTRQPSVGGIAVNNSTKSTTLAPDLALTFRNGVSLSAAFNKLDQQALNGGNETRTLQRDLTASANYAFLLPASVSQSRKQVRTSLSAVVSKNESCLQTASASDCATISDLLRHEIRGGADMDFNRILTAGLQFGYTMNDARYLNRKFTQIVLSANFTLSLFSGDYR